MESVRTADANDATTIAEFLTALDEDPAAVAGRYGKQSGNCCFCNTHIETNRMNLLRTTCLHSAGQCERGREGVHACQ